MRPGSESFVISSTLLVKEPLPLPCVVSLIFHDDTSWPRATHRTLRIKQNVDKPADIARLLSEDRHRISCDWQQGLAYHATRGPFCCLP